jgi:hypothetical protein
MSNLNQLNKRELEKLAAKADVVLDGDETNKQIVAKLKENNVSYEFYKKAILDAEDAEDDGEPLFADSPILLKMERHNPSFQAFGFKFTREHPYALMSPEQAQQIIDTHEGFRLASPAEAKSFYS